MLQKSFTDEERAYLDGLSAKIPIGLKFDSYPICFYNEKEKEFQGIAVDILTGISKLTGIEFEIANSKNTPWAKILEEFKAGRMLVVADLMITEERREHFIWTATPFFSSRHVFISKADYPYLEPYQIAHVTVGTVKGSIFEDMYGLWFQSNDNLKLYPTLDVLLNALENGDVDLVLVSESHLLFQTNYREKSGFKINYAFPTSVYSYFGFNRGEEILRSIFDKAMAHVPVDRISKDWTSRMYDYSRKLAEERSIFMTVSTSALTLMLGLLTFLYLKDRKKRETIAEQASILSAIYNSVPAMLFTKDLNNRYTSCNSKFLEEAKLSEEE
jgi:ABC-type amino acid transport substrate-binding protein